MGGNEKATTRMTFRVATVVDDSTPTTVDEQNAIFVFVVDMA